MTGGEAVVRSLAGEGVEVVFGLPGVHAMYLYDALHGHREMRYVGVRHEQAAAYMADGYARATGRVGVCLTTTGPGAANTVAAVAEAYTSSSPVLHITTQISSPLLGLGRGALHEVEDQLGWFRSISGWNQRVQGPADVPLAIRRAMKGMRTARPRPAVLEIPADVLAAEAEVVIPPPERYDKPRGDPAGIREAARLLAESSAPLVWAGGGVISSGATAELVRLAETIEAPVLTTYMGKGAMPEDHPLSLGNWCREGEARELLQGFLAERDLMLAVGTRFSAISTAEWTLHLPARLIQVDIDEGELGKSYPVEIGIIGDAGAVLGGILEHLDSLKGKAARRSPVGDIAEFKVAVGEIVMAARAEEVGILQAFRGALGHDAILVNDMAVMSYLASRYFEAYEPRTFLYPMGLGTMGFSFPAALGAKMGCPQRQIVSICGDGGFMLSCQELATAVQHGIKLPVVVFNDGGYGVLRETQDLEFGGRRLGVDLVNPDFVRFAESFGAYGLRVRSPEGLKAALGIALKADRPTLIEYLHR